MQISVKEKWEMIIAVINNEMYKKNIYSLYGTRCTQLPIH
jgi:hypothetical protein